MSEQIVDLDQLNIRVLAIETICRIPWWTKNDASEYIGCSAFRIKILFEKGFIQRNRENLTKREWVDEYLNKPYIGKIRKTK